MSITRHKSRLQVCCDHCPASYPNTYEAEDFDVMISDARTAGWRIVKAKVDAGTGDDTSDLFGQAPRVAGKKPDKQGYLHICPDCQKAPNVDRRALV
ncbi:hypothetical protein NA8A_04375 [Nitratireductor indicus C115]|uniref:Uncharacterized protein n=1 Tax=Nitratireductor indicus C115 TaxID=1231190 RepID=K2PSG8_9HYPH|nr:hypothetical protein [Nitratireductor indicus]EKF44017.1 hypothetical protein NA8A_04375 [Nitratireductor indicus C115]SFQ11978.1 hypothetical protein SAMN05216176_101437 [Nitratireductor indicus]